MSLTEMTTAERAVETAELSDETRARLATDLACLSLEATVLAEQFTELARVMRKPGLTARSIHGGRRASDPRPAD